jgi:hypothetical protein
MWSWPVCGWNFVSLNRNVVLLLTQIFPDLDFLQNILEEIARHLNTIECSFDIGYLTLGDVSRVICLTATTKLFHVPFFTVPNPPTPRSSVKSISISKDEITQLGSCPEGFWFIFFAMTKTAKERIRCSGDESPLLAMHCITGRVVVGHRYKTKSA